MLKQVFLFLFFFISPVLLSAQQSDSLIVKKDSAIINDSSFAKQSDTLNIKYDTVVRKDTVLEQSLSYSTVFKKLLADSRFLNSTGKPVAMVSQIRKPLVQDKFFYLIAIIGLMVGFLRFFYTRYFNNLFRVFFNASLRQSQLTDQLLQAKLPSLFFNILFVISGGVYVYLLLHHKNLISIQNFWSELLYCTLSLGIIYFIKFITLKFTGWLTGYTNVTNTYVFIIFLINKILGILLVPFTVIIAFSLPELAAASVIISLLLIGLMLLLRFFRS